MKEFINSGAYLLTEENEHYSTMYYMVDTDNNEDMLYPTAEELISRLKDPEYLNYSLYLGENTERQFYLFDLAERPDLTETQKRMVKLYQSKL
jgi:hypothetical protein